MRLAALALILLTLQAAAQQQQPPQLSLRSAYDQASAPVDITRRSLSNWSDTEISSLAAAIAQANDACSQRAFGR